MNFKRKEIENVINDDPWAFGNGVLYDLCMNYPKHTDPDVVMAKIWLIGRSYAAAVERRRKFLEIPNDDFYTDKVAPKLINSKIDPMIDVLRDRKLDEEGILIPVAQLHRYLQNTLHKITDLEKRSLASKYLHFHLPKLFFIYDSRAEQALRKALPRFRTGNAPRSVDETYYKFINRCMALRSDIKKQTNLNLNPRDLDRVLLKI